MKKRKRYMLIYNPSAGKKRHLFSRHGSKTLREMVELLQDNGITADVFITKDAEDARKFTSQAIQKKYDVLIAAGGDGTVGEIAGHLVGTDITLGVLPMGTYMNTARMLAIPKDLEKAIALLVEGNVRKIDVGKITQLNGKKLRKPYYFMEAAGVGYEAKLYEYGTKIEHGRFSYFANLWDTIRKYRSHPTTVVIDTEEPIETDANSISISNGPFTGPAVRLAAHAKLNDHRLAVAIMTKSKIALFTYLFRVMNGGTNRDNDIKWYRAKEVKITSVVARKVQADSRIFGATPVTFTVEPNALSVITGVPKNKKFIAGNK